VVKLIETSACDGLSLPLIKKTCRLDAINLGPITSVALHQGADITEILATIGLKMPEPGAVSQGNLARLVWSAPGQAFLIGIPAPVGLSDHASLSDQSDAWATVSLSGPDASAVLARLTPLDLRDAAFPVGSVARSLLGHLSCTFLRDAEDAFTLMVFRSMASNMVGELGIAIRTMAARHTLT
jgi:heterotetrameric sarcosine oxidase gamma subunit